MDRAALLPARAAGSASEPIRKLIAFEANRARQLYASALPGIDLVERSSRDCLRTAWTLYGAILDEIERADYDVFSRRCRSACGAGSPSPAAAWSGPPGRVTSADRARTIG